MRRILLFVLSMGMFTTLHAQIELVPNPCDINSGTITIKYGESADYSIFDPLSDPNLYIYSGLETDGDAMTWDYHDDWANTATLIPLTYDNTLGYYVATFNPATRSYVEESTMNTVTIPQGTQVNDWYFIIRNLAGDRQSGNLKGTDYGFTAGTLSIDKFSSVEGVHPMKGSLFIENPGKYTITIHNMLGQEIYSSTLEIETIGVHDLELQKQGIYMVRISKGSKKSVFKIIR